MTSPHKRALQSDIPPRSKSDNEWLRDMGYHGKLDEFMRDYGFKIGDCDEEKGARRLMREFRDQQQEAWETLRRDKTSSTGSGKPGVGNTASGGSAAKKE